MSPAANPRTPHVHATAPTTHSITTASGTELKSSPDIFSVYLSARSRAVRGGGREGREG